VMCCVGVHNNYKKGVGFFSLTCCLDDFQVFWWCSDFCFWHVFRSPEVVF
jgi:hypothetical protein